MAMSVNFVGTVVSCYTEDDVLVIGIGDDESSPENFVIISRLDEEDTSGKSKDEVANNIGIQTHLSTHEVSGAIDRVHYWNDRLEIGIHPEKQEEVGISNIVVTITPVTSEKNSLLEYLRAVFSGTSVELDIAE